jgi:hypothetical protein
MRKIARGLALLLGWACLVVFFSVSYERTVEPPPATPPDAQVKPLTRDPTLDHVRLRLGFTPAPWFVVERRKEVAIERVSSGAYAVTARESRSFDFIFACWSWAFAAGALVLLVSARMLKRRA